MNSISMGGWGDIDQQDTKKNPIETMERGEKKIVLDGWAREIGRHGDQSDFFVFVSCANWFLFCWFRLPFFRVWTQKKVFVLEDAKRANPPARC